MVVTETAREFGEALRREREQRGITLEHVAEVSKISATVMAGLERGDLSRWPPGLFRRAFVRAYAEAVGLPSEQVVQAFIDVHGDGGQAPKAIVEPRRIEQACRGEIQALRLRLAGEPERPAASWLSRAGAVAVDLAVPCVVGSGAAIVLGVPAVVGIGGAALCSLLVSSAWAKSTLGQEVIRRALRGEQATDLAPAPASLLADMRSDDAPVPLIGSDAEPRRAVEAARPGARVRRSSRERARVQRASRHA